MNVNLFWCGRRQSYSRGAFIVPFTRSFPTFLVGRVYRVLPGDWRSGHRRGETRIINFFEEKNGDVRGAVHVLAFFWRVVVGWTSFCYSGTPFVLFVIYPIIL